MRPTDKIETLIKNASIRTDTQSDRKILDEVLDAFEETKQKQTGASQVNIWRIIMKSRTTKLAAAAVIVIAGIVCVQFLTGTNASAQVVQEIKNARTVVYTVITQTNEGNGETVKTDIAYKEPGHLRTSTVDGYICILDFTNGKMISIVPGLRVCTIGEMKDLGKTGTQGVFASFEAMKNLPTKADETIDPKEIDGIVCRGYRVKQGDLTTTVWIDAKTSDLVQVEQKYASAPGMNKIIKNIKFDEVLDDSLFSLTPPAGYKMSSLELTSDGTAETEETFIAWLRWWSNMTVDGTFPPIVVGPQIAKIFVDMAREGKFKDKDFKWSNADTQQMFHALLFVPKLPKESNWRYAGNGVKINTPDTPIFWYRPAGNDKYRVIYADLTVREMTEGQLPK
jgi:outer membrane lipoprotein-sorting protein